MSGNQLLEQILVKNSDCKNGFDKLSGSLFFDRGYICAWIMYTREINSSMPPSYHQKIAFK